MLGRGCGKTLGRPHTLGFITEGLVEGTLTGWMHKATEEVVERGLEEKLWKAKNACQAQNLRKGS